jgi:hypothetical protein
MTRTCTGAWGLISRKAIVRGLAEIIVAGISLAAMPQNRQSGTQKILTCDRSGGRPTYMVALLRTHGAPPLWCNGPAICWLSVAPGCVSAGAL